MTSSITMENSSHEAKVAVRAELDENFMTVRTHPISQRTPKLLQQQNTKEACLCAQQEQSGRRILAEASLVDARSPFPRRPLPVKKAEPIMYLRFC